MNKFLIYIIPVLLITSCQPQQQTEETTGDEVQQEQVKTMVYEAELNPINTTLYEDSINGSALFIIKGDSLTLRVSIAGTPPGIMHLQHLHGKEDGSLSSCPGEGADQNDDGIIDLIETQEAAGVTMIPLHDDPVSLEIKTNTYPTAEEDGSYIYEKRVLVSELTEAVQEKFNIEDPKLENMVVFIHGAPEADVPASVQSLPEVPAHVTVPIACGEVQMIEE